MSAETREMVPGIPIPKINPETGKPFTDEEKRAYTRAGIEKWKAGREKRLEKARNRKPSPDEILLGNTAYKFGIMLENFGLSEEEVEFAISQIFGEEVFPVMTFIQVGNGSK